MALDCILPEQGRTLDGFSGNCYETAGYSPTRAATNTTALIPVLIGSETPLAPRERWVPAGCFLVEEVDHVHRGDRAVVHGNGDLFPVGRSGVTNRGEVRLNSVHITDEGASRAAD